MAVVGVFNDTSVTRHHGCNAVMQTLRRELDNRGVKVAYYWPVGVDWQKHRQLLSKCPVDAIIVNGEGSIHHSRVRPRARYLAELGAFASSSLNVPSYLINATIEALEDETLTALGSFHRVYVRETGSQRYLAENGLDSQIVPDLSFLTPVPEPFTQTRAGVLVTDSVDADARKKLSQWSNSVGAHFHSMQIRKPWLERKLGKLTRAVAPRSPSLKSDLTETTDFLGFVRELLTARAVVTGRFHTVTLSILTGTPVCALPSNTRKISNVLTDVLGDPSRVTSFDQLMRFDSAPAFADAVQYSLSERQAIDRYIARARAAAAEMFDGIAAASSA
jgi:polysaccharide pyruvyl transferase WcaK-like protein